MARFNVTLPASIAKLLDQDAERQDIARSTLIAQHIAQHYEGRSAADYEAEIRELRTEYEKQAHTHREECANIVQRVRDEHEKHSRKLIAEHDAELQQIRADCEKQIQQINADNSASMQQFASSQEELETVTQKLDTKLKESEERNRSLMKEMRQSEASKNTIVTGLQHEMELLRQQIANSEATLHIEQGHLSELRKDKETLQKQLELVTLRLPAPKIGFWARLFGSPKREKEAYDSTQKNLDENSGQKGGT